jgi:hypothetical protein
MVEIAIAIGVIGFALVAIIGILPAGLNVQRDNRSETIINQDATFWLEAIKSGAVGVDELTSYVTKVVIEDFNSVSGQYEENPTKVYTLNGGFTTGSEIIGLITSAADFPDSRAVVHCTAFSGSAAEKELDPTKREIAFSYIMRVLIDQRRAPDNDIDDTALPFESVAGNAMAVEEHFGYPRGTSLSEIRLTFLYPYVSDSKPPPRSQTFRASAARQLVNDPTNSVFFYLRP